METIYEENNLAQVLTLQSNEFILHDPDRRFSYSNLSIFGPPDTLAAPALLRRVFPPSLNIVAFEEAVDGVVFLGEDLAGSHAVDDRVAWSANVSASTGVRVSVSVSGAGFGGGAHV